MTRHKERDVMKHLYVKIRRPRYSATTYYILGQLAYYMGTDILGPKWDKWIILNFKQTSNIERKLLNLD